MTGGVADEITQLLHEWRDRQQKAFESLRRKEQEVQRLLEGCPEHCRCCCMYSDCVGVGGSACSGN